MSILEDKLMQSIDDAKLILINKKNFTFIGSMLYQLKPVVNTSIESIYLDGINKEVHINPDWFCDLLPEYKASSLAHVVLHYSLSHDIRQGNREYAMYQNACDQVVNNMLMDFNFKLEDSIEVDRQYQNKTVETVYKNMLDERDRNKNKSQPNNNNPLGKDLPNNPSSSNTGNSETQNNRNKEVSNANLQNEMSGGDNIGNSNESFKQLFEEIEDGSMDWRIILSEFMNELSKGDREYVRFDRRMLSLGYYMPDCMSDNQIDKVALALDVSGSITTEQIHLFLEEMRLIKTVLDPEIINVMTFNHDLVDVLDFKREDSIDNVPLNISGGTSLEPVFEHYNKSENQPDFLVVFSDLECYAIPEQEKPKYPVVWICFDNKRANVNFGKLIHVKTEDLLNN